MGIPPFTLRHSSSKQFTKSFHRWVNKSLNIFTKNSNNNYPNTEYLKRKTGGNTHTHTLTNWHACMHTHTHTCINSLKVQLLKQIKQFQHLFHLKKIKKITNSRTYATDTFSWQDNGICTSPDMHNVTYYVQSELSHLHKGVPQVKRYVFLCHTVCRIVDNSIPSIMNFC